MRVMSSGTSWDIAGLCLPGLDSLDSKQCAAPKNQVCLKTKEIPSNQSEFNPSSKWQYLTILSSFTVKLEHQTWKLWGIQATLGSASRDLRCKIGNIFVVQHGGIWWLYFTIYIYNISFYIYIYTYIYIYIHIICGFKN